jgi:hypothetical protein
VAAEVVAVGVQMPIVTRPRRSRVVVAVLAVVEEALAAQAVALVVRPVTQAQILWPVEITPLESAAQMVALVAGGRTTMVLIVGRAAAVVVAKQQTLMVSTRRYRQARVLITPAVMAVVKTKPVAHTAIRIGQAHPLRLVGTPWRLVVAVDTGSRAEQAAAQAGLVARAALPSQVRRSR